MPRLELDLTSITQARAQAADARRALLTGARAVADLRNQLKRMQRDGADAQALAQVQRELSQRESEQRSRFEQSRGLEQHIGTLSAGLLGRQDPSLMVNALKGGVPVALLPVRIETRYVGNPVQLAVRIYPDTLHVMRHIEGLTAAERERGEAYWRARFERVAEDGDGEAQKKAAEARAAALWREMVALYRAPRAAWIVRILQPENLDAMGTAEMQPAFPNDVADVTGTAKQPYAVVLPDRWCAVGIRNGVQVFRVWGNHVPDVLPMGLQLDPDAPLPDGEQRQFYGGDRKWLIDFEAAQAVGMGLTVRASDLASSYTFAQGLDRLVVLGVDWTLDENDSAAALAALIAAHQSASEFAFVPSGTPTNNTGNTESGFAGPNTDASPPQNVAVAPGGSDAVDLLRHALGFDDGVLDAANIPHADLAEQRTAMHMINALWHGTFGRYLRLMWNPWYPVTNPDSAQDDAYRLVPKSAISASRDFAKRYLRPGGPLPAFRVDKQPYGLLPVVAPSYQPEAGPTGATARNVKKVIGALRPRWKLSSQKVPRMIDGDLKTATDLIQTGPWSRVMKARGVDDPMASYQTPVIEGTAEFTAIGNQQTIKAAWTEEILGLFGIHKALPREAMIDMLMMAAEPRAMAGVPWVEADSKQPRRERAPQLALSVNNQGKNYVQMTLEALGLPDNQAKAALNAQQRGTSLLQQLLAFSAEEEFDHAGSNLLVGIDQATTTKPFGRTLVSQAPSALVNIEAPVATESWREIRTTRELAALKVPSVTGHDTIEAHIARAVRSTPIVNDQVSALAAADVMRDAVMHLPFYLRDLGELKSSLNYLAGRSVGELDLALKTTLDAYSYRLDAWITALASRQLESVRASRPQGLYFGGYGWVEQLPPPQVQPDSLGYVHAPSLAQAITAAILRSGHLANHESAKGTFNIDLSSQRVHTALSLLQGVARGQSLAALLGYRFERALRDSLLGEYTLDFRRAFPLRPASDNPADGPQEQIAARDVVDGIKLLTQFEQGLATVIAAANARRAAAQPPLAPIAAAHQAVIGQHLTALAQTWDAVSDVLVAEGVYQVAQGNLERAGAALAVLDKQERPVSPQVTQTPRIGVSYAQRLAVVCESDALAQDWAGASADDARSAAEPLLNAWLARMLGDPQRFVFRARVMRGDAIDADALELSPHQLGWSPLTLVMASRAVSGSGQAQHSALRARIAQALAAQVPNPDPTTSLMIEAEGGRRQLGLAQFEALASTLSHLVASARPLTRKDLVIPRDEIEVNLPQDEGEYPGADLAEIEARAVAAVGRLDEYITDLAAAADAPTLALRLAEGWTFDIVEAQPATAPDATGEALADPNSLEQLRIRRDRAVSQGLSKLAAAAALAPDAEAQADAGHSTRVQNAVERIKQVYGNHFPVLPRFTLGDYAAEVASTLGERKQLTVGDELAPLGWLPKLARVREGSDRLNAALSVHDALLTPTAPGDLKLAQLPYRKDQVWAALPDAWANTGDDPDAPRKNAPRLAWVAHAPAALQTIDPARALAGLLVDEWQEFVPSEWQTTGISFHYDAPGSRAPQSVLLAVPPALNMENWTFQDLFATVTEAFDLAKLRAVRPQDLVEGLGLMLPGNYLPENPTADVPSVRINELIKVGLAKYSGTLVLGKV